jgi:hypothetical protein
MVTVAVLPMGRTGQEAEDPVTTADAPPQVAPMSEVPEPRVLFSAEPVTA